MQHRPVLAFLFLSLLATSVQADPPQERNGKHHGKDKPHASGRNDDRQNENGERKARDHLLTRTALRFVTSMREIHRACHQAWPSGAANFRRAWPKRGGKLPPGLSRVRC